jgi:hypothetical protein
MKPTTDNAKRPFGEVSRRETQSASSSTNTTAATGTAAADAPNPYFEFRNTGRFLLVTIPVLKRKGNSLPAKTDDF